MTKTKIILIGILATLFIGGVGFGLLFWARMRVPSTISTLEGAPASPSGDSSASPAIPAVAFMDGAVVDDSDDDEAFSFLVDDDGNSLVDEAEAEDALRAHQRYLNGTIDMPTDSVSVSPSAGQGTGGSQAVAPRTSGSADDDHDGLTNDQELQAGTDVNNPDTDGDGLSDASELREHRTDPKRFDTDVDGLTDGEEVMQYHTDPLVADSDGDGYADGVEVQGGYNPLGTGRLP